jgi:uncharacterized linocin/CFP29 family protein
MDFLKRELAPVVDAAWEQIDQHAARVLRANLSARQVVDFKGPKGFDFPAVNLGRLAPADENTDDGVRYGIRQVQPLVEVCVPFELDIWELDNMARGAGDISPEAVVSAAHKLARFEERAVYLGFSPGQIGGLAQMSQHSPVPLGGDAGAYPDAVARALMVLTDAGVAGPYALVLGPRPYRLLAADVALYPARQRIAKLIEGPILLSPVLNGGFLVALRGGDFELHVGLDASIGYHHHDQRRVSLFLTESFAFRVLGPEAVIRLEIAG